MGFKISLGKVHGHFFGIFKIPKRFRAGAHSFFYKKKHKNKNPISSRQQPRRFRHLFFGESHFLKRNPVFNDFFFAFSKKNTTHRDRLGGSHPLKKHEEFSRGPNSCVFAKNTFQKPTFRKNTIFRKTGMGISRFFLKKARYNPLFDFFKKKRD